MDVDLVSYSRWQSVYYSAKNRGYDFAHAGSGKAANHPVETVDWYDTVKWCNARSRRARLTPVYYTDARLTQVYTNGEVSPFVKWAASNSFAHALRCAERYRFDPSGAYENFGFRCVRAF